MAHHTEKEQRLFATPIETVAPPSFTVYFFAPTCLHSNIAVKEILFCRVVGCLLTISRDSPREERALRMTGVSWPCKRLVRTSAHSCHKVLEQAS